MHHEYVTTGDNPKVIARCIKPAALKARTRYFLLRRWTRVFFRSLRCFFFDIRLRRFFTTEPTGWPHLPCPDSGARRATVWRKMRGCRT